MFNMQSTAVLGGKKIGLTLPRVHFVFFLIPFLSLLMSPNTFTLSWTMCEFLKGSMIIKGISGQLSSNKDGIELHSSVVIGQYFKPTPFD